MFHGIVLPGLVLWALFGHGSIFSLIIAIWVLSLIFHPWRRWGYYHPYYARRWGWGGPPATPTALDILEERYAKGDVAREEYLQKKQDMTRGG